MDWGPSLWMMAIATLTLAAAFSLATTLFLAALTRPGGSRFSERM